MLASTLLPFALALPIALAFNFPYESQQLQPSDVRNNSDLLFGDSTNAKQPSCKTFPSDKTWPSHDRWTALNAISGGALIKSVPPAAACYGGEYNDAAKCAAVRRGERNALFAYACRNEFGMRSH